MKKLFILLFSIFSLLLYISNSYATSWHLGGDNDLIGGINAGGLGKGSADEEADGSFTPFVSSSSNGSDDAVYSGFLPNVHNLPYAILTAPIDNCTTGYNKPTFRWTYTDHDSSPQGAFNIELATDVNFTSTVYTSGVILSSNNYWTPSSILEGNTYYWRVNVRDANWHEWSVRNDTQKLVISNSVPDAPSALQQLVGTGKSTDLSWNSWTNDMSPRLKFTLSDANSNAKLRYHIQVSIKDGSFQPGDLVVNSTYPAAGWLSNGTTWYDTSLTQNTSYWWRVKAFNDSGFAGAFSSGTITSGQAHFGLDNVAPAMIANLNAVSGFYPGEVKLTWTSTGDDGSTKSIVNGAYRIRYSTYVTNSPSFWTDASSNWTDVVNKYDITQSTSISPNKSLAVSLNGLSYNVTYYVRVWTRDRISANLSSWNGNWSSLSNGATASAQIPVYGVDIDVAEVPFGGLKISTTAINTQTVTVTNTGNTTENYSLRVTSSIAWAVDPSNPGTDQVALQAMFNSVKPSVASFSGATHGLTTSYQSATGGKFSGDQTGANVAPSQQTKVWYLLKTPLSTSTTSQQSLNFYVNAGP